MSKETRGVVFFAYNTPEIDYVKLAGLAARYIKRYMKNNNTCLITDKGTWDYFCSSQGKDQAKIIFDDVVLTDEVHTTNKRVHYDSPWTRFVTQFKNTNKHRVNKYTPYDRTLLLDIDYLVQNDSLDYIFDSDQEVAMFHEAETLNRLPPAESERNLNPNGIPMFWSTAIYFRKNNDVSKLFFDTWAHVTKNYEFYSFLYGFSAGMYRTDFCVSIAAHIINGMGSGELIGSFPGKLVNMSQRDGIAKINDLDDWIYLVNNREENWKDTLINIRNENIHVMNKRALDRSYEKLIELFDKEES